MIGVRVFLYIMYNVSVVLNTSLLAERFCNIKKSKRERETKRLLRVILSRVNYAKKAKGAINHFGSTQFKSDSHFDFPCS